MGADITNCYFLSAGITPIALVLFIMWSPTVTRLDPDLNMLYNTMTEFIEEETCRVPNYLCNKERATTALPGSLGRITRHIAR